MSKFKILAASAGFLLFLKMPARAQLPEDISPPPPAPADQSQEPDQGQASADNGQAQMLSDTAWWLENEGLTFGYLPGGYGYGFGTGSCGGLSGGRGTAWWNAGTTNAWLPAGQQLPYPYGSGWCGSNYGRAPYALVANQLIVPNRHHHGWKHAPGGNANNQTLASASVTKAAHPSNSDEGGPDDDWVRVDDHVEAPRGGATASAASSRNLALRQIGGVGAGRPRSQKSQASNSAQMRAAAHHPQPGTATHAHGVAHPVAAHAVARAAARSAARGHS